MFILYADFNIFMKGIPHWLRVIIVSEIDSIMELFHIDPVKGGHCGRDAMIHAISMII
jgi:hypothetical protein